MSALRIAEITEPGDDLDAVYAELLRPNFPAGEVDSKDDIETALRDGAASVLVALDSDGGRIGVAVVDWNAESRIALLTHLAVDPESRDDGIGGRLLEAARARWAERYRPCAVIAEVQHPSTPASESTWGDPRRRYEFYIRRGARVLDLPYFQPALREGAERGYGMLLMVIHLDPELLVAVHRFDAAPLRGFLTDYFNATEGRLPEDAAGAALFGALDATKGVGLLDPATTPIDLLPRSRP